MSDRTPENQDNPSEAPQNDAINPGRRKLAGAALGAGAVFTLASRPVWANQCTISGMASGNLSAPKVTCDGCTPGYWKQDQHLDSWIPTGFRPLDSTDGLQKADTFNAVFSVDQYRRSNGTPYTLLEVMRELNGNGDPISTNLGFHAVAALLNAAHPNVNFGYTSGEIITLFRANMHNGAALKDSLMMLNERGCPLN
ncbi:MAG: hypothetical protein Q7J36_15680 [Thiobacillus sp.]|nr:hypothetical protein [Thiobacillus sp.]